MAYDEEGGLDMGFLFPHFLTLRLGAEEDIFVVEEVEVEKVEWLYGRRRRKVGVLEGKMG